MAKNSKRRLLLITAVILLLFIFGTFTTVIPKVYAADMTVQQKGLAILKDVVGLDTAEYAVNTKEQSKDSYMGVLPEETVRYELNSNGSKIDVLYTFVNGKLLMLDVLESQGSLRLTKTVDGIAEMAKDFLSSYQSYSGNSFYGELRSSLVGVDLSRNSTKTVGNTKLEVNNYRERVTFRWIYTFNGVDAPDKVVALGYENGFLEYFFDSWDLYKIGSTDINVSEEEAINLGMARARNYSWPAGSNDTLKVENFNVTGAMVWETVFRSSLVADNARNADLLMLYPMRHVWVSLDKFYPPGNVYGFNVYVWADTGEVCHIQERISTVDPPPELVATVADATDTQVNTPTAAFEAKLTSSPNTLIALTPCGILVIGVAWVWLRRKKNVCVRRLFRLSGLLLCLLILSLFSVPIATVNAASPKGRAVVWGSESTGAYNASLGFSWRKHPIEVTRQNAIAAYITENFSSNGYEASDYQGNLGYNSGSWKVAILEKTSENDALYPRVAVVDFDHGNGLDEIPGLPSIEFHYIFEDHYGTTDAPTKEEWETYPVLYEHAVFDMDIYPRTAEGKVFFAFINTCNSAHIDNYFSGSYSKQGIIPGTDRARGMPFAWSHRRPGIDMSADGYGSPDTGDFVFIGFKGGSAALMQAVEGSYPTHYAWVIKFFNDSLSSDLSVNEALDSASRHYFSGRNFDQTNYSKGFIAVWPMYGGNPPDWNFSSNFQGQMKVYGNGNIHLYQKGGVWNLDENSGTTAHDSAHGNDGTIYNGALWWYPKIGNRSVHFDGNNDYMSVPSVSGMSGNTPHSIEAWVRVSSLPPNRAWILLLGNEGTGSHHWLINSQGGTQFGAWNGGQTQPTLPVGKWTHIAMTFDGTTLKCYVNGKLSDSEAATFNLAGTPLTVAQAHNGENYFNGAIDEVHIYDYVLSAGQIADNAAVASYHLNGGDYAYDSSPYGNTGTISGASWATGTRGYGLSFDDYDYVNVPDHYSLDITNAVTVEAWIKPSRLDVWQSPLEKGTHNDWAYGFYIEPAGGNIGFEIGVEGQPVTWAGATAPVNTYLAVGQWTHIAGTADKATGKVYLYINGEKVDDGNFYGQINTNSIPFQVGKRYEGGYFGGIVDEVRIYNRALSSEEIATHYDEMLPTIFREITVLATNQYGQTGYVPLYVDGQYFATTPSTYTATQGNYDIYVLSPITDYITYCHVFDHYYYDGNYNESNPMTLSVTEDITVTAYYNSYYF